jgi:hypothetical protein
LVAGKRALSNSCPGDPEELVEDVIDSINEIRASSQKLHGCIIQSELPPFLR